MLLIVCIPLVILVYFQVYVIKSFVPEQNSETDAADVLKKHLCFYKVASLQACNVIKKRFLHRYFPRKYEKYLKIPILKNICERLLLCMSYIDLYSSL